MDKYTLISNISKLKSQKNALILAHNYQLPEVQEVADSVGDSLSLCRKAAKSQEDIIVFCGVRFMAETAKLLNPKKTVLLPSLNAKCPMADMIDRDTIRELKGRYRDAKVVCYVNSSVDVKAESHISCTSSNAVDIVNSQKVDRIIFTPDRNLASYVEEHVHTKEIIKTDGYCPVHASLTAEDIYKKKAKYPHAKVLVHPECTSSAREHANFVGGTEAIIDYAIGSADEQFLIGTEIGVLHRLKKSCPDKEFHMLSDKLVCPGMKDITLERIHNALLWEQYPINIDTDVHRDAADSLHRMFEI